MKSFKAIERAWFYILGWMILFLWFSQLEFKPVVNLQQVNASPSWLFPLGTDSLGRSVLLQLLVCVQKTVLTLWLSASVALACGWLVAYKYLSNAKQVRSGFQDWFLVVISQLHSVPFFVIIFFIAIFIKDMGQLSILSGTTIVFFLYGFSFLLSRYMESSQQLYWQAHHSFGGTVSQRLLKYGIQSEWQQGMIQQWIFSLQMCLLAEITLSYLGLGIQEPQPSLGNMLSAHMDSYLGGDLSILIIVVGAMVVLSYLPPLIAKLWQTVSSTRLKSH